MVPIPYFQKLIADMKLPSLEDLPLPIHIQILSNTPGRIRLRISPPQRQQSVMNYIASTIKEFLPQIDELRINLRTGSITIYYRGDIDNFAEVINTLEDFGVILNDDVPLGKSQAAAAIANVFAYLNQRVGQTTHGSVDLRLLFSLLLAVLALRQWLAKGPALKSAPWYVLAWYAFDSFLKLNNSNTPPSMASNENHSPKSD